MVAVNFANKLLVTKLDGKGTKQGNVFFKLLQAAISEKSNQNSQTRILENRVP